LKRAAALDQGLKQKLSQESAAFNPTEHRDHPLVLYCDWLGRSSRPNLHIRPFFLHVV